MKTLANTRTRKKEPGTSVDCTDNCTTKKGGLTCKLTTPELRERKATVIASLKKQVLEKKEMKNGFAYKFSGSDTIIDELALFIKTERECCDFFVFKLIIKGDKSDTWLEITGPKGAKEFITTELEF